MAARPSLPAFTFTPSLAFDPLPFCLSLSEGASPPCATEIFFLLAEQGAKIESKSNSGKTPLSYAAEGGHSAIAYLLLDRGADLESTDEWGQTPQVHAAAEGFIGLAWSLKLRSIEPSK
jgi:ankyrin repeat protein